VSEDSCTYGQQPSYQRLFDEFYRTERAGAIRLSDGGGPFGFDIHLAMTMDDLIRGYEPDCIIETGCFYGDTTAYLARMYKQIPIWTCDTDGVATAITARRTINSHNVTVHLADSVDVVVRAAATFRKPVYYLDAHWNESWPLMQELRSVHAGIVCIHDFDIGHPRFGYDAYGGVRCGPVLLHDALPSLDSYYVDDPDRSRPFPCLQVGRRAGAAFLTFDGGAATVCTESELIKRSIRLPASMS
jgi:hypothetical protein